MSDKEDNAETQEQTEENPAEAEENQTEEAAEEPTEAEAPAESGEAEAPAEEAVEGGAAEENAVLEPQLQYPVSICLKLHILKGSRWFGTLKPSFEFFLCLDDAHVCSPLFANIRKYSQIFVNQHWPYCSVATMGLTPSL